jgi:integrase
MIGLSLTRSPRACRTQRVVLSDGEHTWTVLDGDHRVAEPAEQFLEYLRMLGRSPNTVKSYARALALWWQFLSVYELSWDAVMVEDLGRFLSWLRTGDSRALVSIERRQARFSEGTIALRLQAVCSFYRYQHFNGVEAASRLYERVFSGRHPYKPMLEHLARKRSHERRVVRVARPRRATPPTLTPEQVGLILESCARWEERKRDWDGSVRDRLLWALLAETGIRLGEALALKHRDWHTGLGDTPFVEVVPRDDHPHGLRVKNGGYRKIFISDELDRLYGEYLCGFAMPAPTGRSAISTRGGCS